MASRHKDSLLDIADAWISGELGLGPSPPALLAPPSSKRTAYIRRVESSTPPTSCDPPLPSSAPIVIYSTPYASYSALSLSRSENRIKAATFAMHSSSQKAVGAIPQDIPSRFDGGLDGSSTLPPPPVGVLSPQQLSYETSTSSGSALNWCTPTGEEAHDQTPQEGSPAQRRQIARLEVRNNLHGGNDQKMFTYACESLDYKAGLQPHAYVDNNRKDAARGKRDPPGDPYIVDEFTDEEDREVDKSKSPIFFRRFVQKKSKLMSLSRPNSRTSPIRLLINSHSRTSNSQRPVVSSLMTNSTDHHPATANHSTSPNHPPPPTSPPPSYASVFCQPTDVRSLKDRPFV